LVVLDLALDFLDAFGDHGLVVCGLLDLLLELLHFGLQLTVGGFEFLLLVVVLEDLLAKFVDFGAQLLVMVKYAIVEIELLVTFALALLQFKQVFFVLLQLRVILLLAFDQILGNTLLFQQSVLVGVTQCNLAIHEVRHIALDVLENLFVGEARLVAEQFVDLTLVGGGNGEVILAPDVLVSSELHLEVSDVGFEFLDAVFLNCDVVEGFLDSLV